MGYRADFKRIKAINWNGIDVVKKKIEAEKNVGQLKTTCQGEKFSILDRVRKGC